MSEDQAPPADRFDVGIVVARRKLNGPWASHSWLPVSALPAAPDVAPWTRLSGDEREELFFAGSHQVTLHRSETAHYRDNLVSGQPSLWVALRLVGGEDYEIAAVTADPYEGESMAEGIGEIVEALPLPGELQAVVAAFVEAFHVERAFVKRKRDRADSDALGRRGPGKREG